MARQVTVRLGGKERPVVVQGGALAAGASLLLGDLRQAVLDADEDAESAATSAASAAAARDEVLAALIPIDRNIQILDVRGFYSGALAYINPAGAGAINYADRQAAPNLTSALMSAIAAGATLTNSGTKRVEVSIPPGVFTVSSSILIPDGIKLVGSGRGITSSSTHIRRIGDYGDTFQVGVTGPDVSVSNAGIAKLTIYQDHGGDNMYGTSNPPAANFINKATTGVHVRATGPVYCEVHDIDAYGLPGQFAVLGGQSSVFENLFWYGINDPDSVARQESTQPGMLLDSNANTVGINIPTYHRFHNCTQGGATTGNTTVTYQPGGNTVPNSVKDIGATVGFAARCYEEVYITNYNGSAASDVGFEIQPSSTKICQGLHFDGFFGPAGTGATSKMFGCKPLDAGGFASGGQVRVTLLGQGTAGRGVSDIGAVATNGSFVGFDFDIVASSFVQQPVWLEKARNCTIKINARDYNSKNFYTTSQASAVYLGDDCRNIAVTGALGGDVTGARTGHFCINGVYATGWLASGVTVFATDGGLLGSLFVGPPANSVTAAQTTNYNLTGFVSAPNQFHIGTLTSTITATLLPALPTGKEPPFTVARSGAGAFALQIAGLTTTGLATNQWVTYSPVAGVGWLKTAGGNL